MAAEEVSLYYEEELPLDLCIRVKHEPSELSVPADLPDSLEVPGNSTTTLNYNLTINSRCSNSKRGRGWFLCEICNKTYATSSNLIRHQVMHDNPAEAGRQCTDCDKVYLSQAALNMHILTHQRRFNCNICKKSFSRPWLLQGHLRGHTGERPYSCDICEKRFADRSNLRAHMQTHSVSRDFVCEICGKDFTLKSYLQKHMISTHPETTINHHNV